MQNTLWRYILTKIKRIQANAQLPDLMDDNTAILHIKVDDKDVHVSTLAPYDNEAVELATLAGVLLERALDEDNDYDLLYTTPVGHA